ncbi:IS30 family transposase [Porphyromonas circumdentaria]|uniref:hypothetical protein n=1 Tax=Porphyromonas circumdentaria TaxID=29524 RepID=UPI000999EC18|nr:hypothetical protein [Porphyromonas circumdentaria]MBB6276570.1 IS30 family transposase [Porphyromonas circumdentaria]
MKYRRKSLAKPLKSQWEQRKGIDQRPECIHQEEHSRDFEINLIIGAKQQEAILTLTDRKTDYAIIEPLPKGGKLQIKTIQSLLNNRPRKKLNFRSPIEALDVYLQQRCT